MFLFFPYPHSFKSTPTKCIYVGVLLKKQRYEAKDGREDVARMEAFLELIDIEEAVVGWNMNKDMSIFNYCIGQLKSEHRVVNPNYNDRLLNCFTIGTFKGLTPAKLLDAFKTRFENKNYKCFPLIVNHNASTDEVGSSGSSTIIPEHLEAFIINPSSSGIKHVSFFSAFVNFFVGQIIAV